MLLLIEIAPKAPSHCAPFTKRFNGDLIKIAKNVVFALLLKTAKKKFCNQEHPVNCSFPDSGSGSGLKKSTPKQRPLIRRREKNDQVREGHYLSGPRSHILPKEKTILR
jgi:hypothetical protein